jgi:hypothetical protein
LDRSKSRESICHYLAVRAVVEGLRLPQFCEFAKEGIPVGQLVPLIDNAHIVAYAEHAWQLELKCKIMPVADYTFDFVRMCTGSFAISPNLR